MRENPLRLLVEDGVSEKKARSIVATKPGWQIRKNVFEHSMKRVPKWRCPVHGCLLEVPSCLDCKIEAHRKLTRLAKTAMFRGRM